MFVVATAGHVDHGKSTLVRALTGTDPDRFAEEKARGLTIDLGFAWTTLGSGRELAFVDVPGHVRFIKHLLAGVGGVAAGMFVVPGSPRARVRGLQSLKQTHQRVGPGSRVAVNLSGIGRDDLARGSAIVRPRQWHLTRTFDASLRVLDSLDHEVGRKGAYQAYVGSGEHPVSLRVLPGGRIGTGEGVFP